MGNNLITKFLKSCKAKPKEPTQSKREKIVHTFEKEISQWEIDQWSEERILNDVKYSFEYEIRRIINNRMELVFNDEILDKLARELLTEYDFKSTVQSVMQEKMKEYLRKL